MLFILSSAGTCRTIRSEGFHCSAAETVSATMKIPCNDIWLLVVRRRKLSLEPKLTIHHEYCIGAAGTKHWNQEHQTFAQPELIKHRQSSAQRPISIRTRKSKRETVEIIPIIQAPQR
jgi:hypothetical protein